MLDDVNPLQSINHNDQILVLQLDTVATVERKCGYIPSVMTWF